MWAIAADVLRLTSGDLGLALALRPAGRPYIWCVAGVEVANAIAHCVGRRGACARDCAGTELGQGPHVLVGLLPVTEDILNLRTIGIINISFQRDFIEKRVIFFQYYSS